MPETLRILLADLIDYAGLFPPAHLSMQSAVEAYNRARVGEHEWMLGRFICPASRLGEFEHAAGPLLPGTLATSGYREAAVGEPWRVSAIVDGPLEGVLAGIDAFNAAHAEQSGGLAIIDALEMKVEEAGQIDPALEAIPEDIHPFFEFPAGADPRGFIAALSGERASAKIRTGGVVPQAFPAARDVAEFIRACDAADVPFKATAGLHHPVRGSYRLTYEAGSGSCVMHGFLNIFMTAAFVRAKGYDPGCVAELLAEENLANFTFSGTLATWREHGLEAGAMARVRESFALSFGSCSFDEPVEDLRRGGML